MPAAIAPWVLTAVHHAHWGVDLFFVLSGFSLAQGYRRAFCTGQAPPSARAFFLRRAARILPGYYVALLVTLLVHRSVFGQADVGLSLATHAAVLQGYVTPGGIEIIGASWSLTTEIGFYLLLPLLARPLLGRSPRGWLVGAALVASAWMSRSVLHDLVLDPAGRTALLEATQRRWITSRLDQFVLGALAARAHGELVGSRAAARLAAPVGVLATVLLLVGFRLEGELYLEPGGAWPYAILSLATAALVLAATLLSGAPLRLLANTPLCSIGLVSYGVFLYHQLALGLVGWALRGDGALVFAANGGVALAASLALGGLSWRWIEQPAMEWARRRPLDGAREVAPSSASV